MVVPPDRPSGSRRASSTSYGADLLFASITQGFTYAALLLSMKVLFDELDFKYPIVVSTVNSFLGLCLAQWRYSGTKAATASSTSAPISTSTSDGLEEAHPGAGAGVSSSFPLEAQHGRGNGSADAPKEDHENRAEGAASSFYSVSPDDGASEGAGPGNGDTSAQALAMTRTSEKSDIDETYERVKRRTLVLSGFFNAGTLGASNVALMLLDSVSYGMLMKNMLVSDLLVFFLLDSLYCRAEPSSSSSTVSERPTKDHAETESEPLDHRAVDVAVKTRAGKAGLQHTQAEEAATESLSLGSFKTVTGALPLHLSHSTDIGDDDTTTAGSYPASSSSSSTAGGDEAEGVSGSEDQRAISQNKAEAGRPLLQHLQDQRQQVSARTTATTTPESSSGTSPKTAGARSSLLFPWDATRPLNLGLQCALITVGAVCSAAYVVQQSAGRRDRAATKPEDQHDHAAPFGEVITGVFSCFTALLFGSGLNAMRTYCCNAEREPPAWFVRTMMGGPATVEVHAEAERIKSKLRSVDTVEFSAEVSKVTFLALAFFALVFEIADVPRIVSPQPSNTARTATPTFLTAQAHVAGMMVLLILAFCCVLGFCLSLINAEVSKLVDPVAQSCFRYSNFVFLAVMSYVLLTTLMTPLQLLFSAVMFAGVLWRAWDHYSRGSDTRPPEMKSREVEAATAPSSHRPDKETTDAPPPLKNKNDVVDGERQKAASSSASRADEDLILDEAAQSHQDLIDTPAVPERKGGTRARQREVVGTGANKAWLCFALWIAVTSLAMLHVVIQLASGEGAAPAGGRAVPRPELGRTQGGKGSNKDWGVSFLRKEHRARGAHRSSGSSTTTGVLRAR